MNAIVMVMMSDEEMATFGRGPEPGFGALRTSRGLLPLVAMEVDARVVGVIANTDLAQTFVNTTGTPIEATYIFPLPDRAAVHRFRMEVGGRVIEGTIDERGAARANYDQAIAQGHRAAIAEEERPGVFTMRVGNLMPGEAATVRLSLVGPLPVDDGEVTFQFPLVVAQRYMPGYGLGGEQAGLGSMNDTNLVPDASRISPPVLLPGMPNPVRLRLRVAIEDPHLDGLASSLHSVVVSKQDACIVDVVPGERLDRDFILRWRIDPRAQMRSQLVCTDDADGRGGTFMVTLVPPSTTSVAAKPRDVVFVLDRSGSMEGWKMVAARRATARMIDTLTSRDRFCAIAFDNALELLPESSLVDATDRARFRAVERLAKVDSRGGTEMAEPLRLAAQMLVGYDDRERVIVLVTDGQVGNEDHLLRELGPALANVRVFALGIDKAVNAGFLRRLAAIGGGLCELVESEDRLDVVMSSMHRRIGAPVATDLALQPHGLDVDLVSFAPRKLPDVYAGAPVTLFGRYHGTAPANAAMQLHATVGAGAEPMNVRIERRASAPAPTRWLAASWARAHIRDLEDQYAIGTATNHARAELEKQIVTVSKHFGVLSRFTAFLAVDAQRVVNPGGYLHQVVQAVERAGTGGAGSMPDQVRSSPPAASRARSAGYNPPSAAYSPPSSSNSAAPSPMHPMAASPMASSPMRAPAPAPRDASEAKSESPREASSAPRAPGASPLAPPLAPPLSPRAELHMLVRMITTAQGDATTLRMLRQRLTQWLEALRATGSEPAMVAAVEAALQPLSSALASNTNLATVAATLATELANIANGVLPPARPPSREAFWK